MVEQLLAARTDSEHAHRWQFWFVPILTILWLLAITGTAVVLSLIQVWYLLRLTHSDRERLYSLVVAIAIMATTTAITTGVGFVLPHRWRLTVVALVVVPVPVLLVTSHNVIAGIAALALLFPIFWLGRELVAWWLRPLASGAAWSLGSALGTGLLIILSYCLLRIGLLRPYVIWPLWLTGTLLLITLAGRRLRQDLARFLTWTQQPLERPSLLLALWGIVIGYLWLNLLGALAPEMMADAVRQRMPAAQLFAQAGRLVTRHDLGFTWHPTGGEFLYALVLTTGPLQTAKIVNFLIGLCCAATVWMLGRQIGGDRVAAVAAIAFYSLPLTAWLSQTAYTDLFAILFALATALIVVLRERLTWRTAIAIAVFLGFGLSIKATNGAIAIGVAIAMLMLMAERRWILIALALLVPGALGLALLISRHQPQLLLPLPGYERVTHLVTRIWSTTTTTIAGLSTFGSHRSFIDLARSPFDLTFATLQYGEYQRGFTGYLLLAFVPLTIFARPRRRTILVLVIGGSAYLAWFYLAQYVRYAMPFFGILCAIGAYTYISLVDAMPNQRTRPIIQGVLLVLVGLSVIAYLKTTLIYPGNVPYRAVLGLETKSDYLRGNVGAYTALRLLNKEPNATRAFAPYEYARLYSHVTISSVLSDDVAVTWAPNEAAALRALDAGGYTHIIVDRNLMMPYWDEIIAINEDFLRRNAVLVGGDHNGYLYRLVPPAERGHDQQWARGNELLPNGGFEESRDSVPLGWTAIGHPYYDTSGKQSHSGSSAIRATPTDILFTPVSVTPNVQYLLSHATKSADGAYDLARLQINWLNSEGKFISATVEVVPTSPRGYFVHSMLATAPPTARSAMVYVQAQQGTVWFDDFSLKSVLPDQRAVSDSNSLADSNFTDLLQGTSAAWQPYGKQGPNYASVEADPTSGAKVSARPDSGFVQNMSIKAGRSYQLAYTAWSQIAAQARLQINWMDANQKFIASTIQVRDIGDQPARYTAWMTAPQGAAYAVGYVSVQRGGPVWFSSHALNEEQTAGASRISTTLAVSNLSEPATRHSWALLGRGDHNDVYPADRLLSRRTHWAGNQLFSWRSRGKL